jgi:hypothetical protein
MMKEGLKGRGGHVRDVLFRSVISLFLVGSINTVCTMPVRVLVPTKSNGHFQFSGNQRLSGESKNINSGICCLH